MRDNANKRTMHRIGKVKRDVDVAAQILTANQVTGGCRYQGGRVALSSADSTSIRQNLRLSRHRATCQKRLGHSLPLMRRGLYAERRWAEARVARNFAKRMAAPRPSRSPASMRSNLPEGRYPPCQGQAAFCQEIVSELRFSRLFEYAANLVAILQLQPKRARTVPESVQQSREANWPG